MNTVRHRSIFIHYFHFEPERNSVIPLNNSARYQNSYFLKRKILKQLQHTRADSRYQAIRGGTNGCSRCHCDPCRISRDERLSLAARVSWYQVDKLVSLMYSTLCSQHLLLLVFLLDMLTHWWAFVPQHSLILSPILDPYFEIIHLVIHKQWSFFKWRILTCICECVL